MSKNVDLLEGPIASSLAKLAFPIMGTSLIQMAYNLTDMIWIGRIGSGAVAAVGAAGMYMWMSASVSTIPRMGGQVMVAQLLGAEDKEQAVQYAKGALQMGILFGILYGLLAVLGNSVLIGFFKLNSQDVIRDARWYLAITCGAVVFNFINQILTGILTAMGNSIVTFRATTIGLLINLVVDPLLIFGVGPFPHLGVAGAAIATVFAQIIVLFVYLKTIWNEPVIFQSMRILEKTKKHFIKEMVRIGIPVATQGVLFTGISMLIARMIAGWGDAAVAVQKVGSQIESISWMTAEGFGTAVNAFVAQNFGAKKTKRIQKGYFTAMGLMTGWGIFTSAVLILFPEALFKIFITEPEVIPMGVDYLRILGISQFFMCTELTSAGAFQGLGRTIPPSVVSIVFTSMRIPMAMVLSATVLGLNGINGIWWSLSLSNVIKGTIMPVWLIIVLRKKVNKAF